MLWFKRWHQACRRMSEENKAMYISNSRLLKQIRVIEDGLESAGQIKENLVMASSTMRLAQIFIRLEDYSLTA